MYNRIRRGDLFPYHPHGCRDFWVEELKGRLSKIRYHTINTVLRLRGGGTFPCRIAYQMEHHGQFFPKIQYLQSKNHSDFSF